ncbi:hypothetical protein UPYG_G00007560 [Umbra pygmaea]|uniref:Matrix remodeling-associated protein 8 n=1 Tax=Umbra pygmaea TaxID=75934 RepID=A0ABD0XHT2_UMBPY
MILFLISVVVLLARAWGQGFSTVGVVVEASNITFPAGSQAVLPCQSSRMVWTRDTLKDRQRVVHWDLVRSSPEYSVERVLDMSPGVKERLYNGFNKGRITIPKTAFTDGNFSLVINNVGTADRGLYTCNLHHHYCQQHQSIQIQLNTTKSARKEKRIWDGDKMVLVVMVGSSVVLPCVNRRPLWVEGQQEDQQQVAHWDWQSPGVRPDGADRLVDLYASGERRKYGPLFSQNQMSVSDDAFSAGDFSLTISKLQPVHKGLYSCHLHHHYCGLNERRIFRLIVGPPLPPAPPLLTAAPAVSNVPDVPHALPKDYYPNVEGPRVVNVILPEQRGHFYQQMGYILATFFLLAFIVTIVIVLTRRRKKRGSLWLEYNIQRSERVHGREEIALDTSELKACNQQHQNSSYKNNLLKERDMSKDCNKEMDGKFWK